MRCRVTRFHLVFSGIALALTGTGTSAALIVHDELGLLFLGGSTSFLSWLAWNRRLKVAWDPVPLRTARAKLTSARIRPGEVVYDLGCGDGRLLIMAAQHYEAPGVGIEIDPVLMVAARFLTRLCRVAPRVQILRADLHQADVYHADVVLLYLNSGANAKLAPRLVRELSPGVRVVSYAHPMPGWEPKISRPSGKAGRYIYVYESTAWQGRA